MVFGKGDCRFLGNVAMGMDSGGGTVKMGGAEGVKWGRKNMLKWKFQRGVLRKSEPKQAVVNS